MMNIRFQLPCLFVLGSSLTIQFGPYLEQELAGRFRYDRKRDGGGERAADNLDIPQGASAGDSSMVLSYLQHRRIHDPIDASVLLLSCGLHDIKTAPATGQKQIPLEQFESNLRESLKEAARMKLQVAWLRITPVIDELHNSRSKSFHRFSKDVDAYNAVADRIMQEGDAFIIDLHRLCLTLLPEALIDHVHYNDEARKIQAAYISSKLSTLTQYPSPL